jgi:hypothetical protein
MSIFIILGVIVIIGYYLSARAHPYRTCPACTGTGRQAADAHGSTFARCRRCGGTGRLVRLDALFHPNRRWLIAGVVVLLVVAWVLLVPAADWLARHDVGLSQGSVLETARNNARGALLTLTAGVLAAAALFFTARNFALSQRVFELTEQGQVTERYTRAIEQLGSDKLDVRIGGIYALERVARDSARDHPTVVEVLSAFVREHSNDQHSHQRGQNPREDRIRPDVQAALTVVGRRYTEQDVQEVDLTGANLAYADLRGAYLAGARLLHVNLTGARLFEANLARVNFFEANLIGADLNNANLEGALAFPGEPPAAWERDSDGRLVRKHVSTDT